MANIVTELSKYIFIVLIAFYALHGFIAFKYIFKDGGEGLLIFQNIYMILIHSLGYFVLFLQYKSKAIMYLYIFEEIIILSTLLICRFVYSDANMLLINNMCMLLSISFIILCRISYNKCLKQFEIVTISLVLFMIIPKFVRLLKTVDYLEWISALTGLSLLLIVLILGSVTNGSKLSFSVAGITFQPSEFVKIFFVIFVARMLSKSREIKNIVLTSIIAAGHILVLVASKDLGGALILSVVYICMLYVATGGLGYLLGGIGAGAIATFIGYKMFSHVRVRFSAWSDPWADIDGKGYQITQSLFAIGTGSWLGMGLTQGSPEKIPVVDADFVFAAISEELGCFFSVCLVLICISTFMNIMVVAMRCKDLMYKLLCVGLGVVYGFQMFLTIGGVTKFIPLTGVTLPLVSYGGTSVLSTLVIFGIVQGVYTIRGNVNASK